MQQSASNLQYLSVAISELVVGLCGPATVVGSFATRHFSLSEMKIKIRPQPSMSFSVLLRKTYLDHSLTELVEVAMKVAPEAIFFVITKPPVICIPKNTASRQSSVTNQSSSVGDVHTM